MSNMKTTAPSGGARAYFFSSSGSGSCSVMPICSSSSLVARSMKLSSVIRAQLKRFLGWRISVKAIARVLRKAGYAPVHRKGRPVGGEQPRRFEAPHRGALWQLDFTELRVDQATTFIQTKALAIKWSVRRSARGPAKRCDRACEMGGSPAGPVWLSAGTQERWFGTEVHDRGHP